MFLTMFGKYRSSSVRVSALYQNDVKHFLRMITRLIACEVFFFKFYISLSILIIVLFYKGLLYMHSIALLFVFVFCLVEIKQKQFTDSVFICGFLPNYRTRICQFCIFTNVNINNIKIHSSKWSSET